MPKASEVAAELRKFVEGLEKNPDAEVSQPTMLFSAGNKEQFLNVARAMPRPMTKSLVGQDSRWPTIELRYRTDAISLWAKVPQSETCTLVEAAKPAVYRCDPILSPEEDAELEAV